MQWYHYALLSASVFPFVNFIDKYIISKEVKDYHSMPIFTSVTGFLVGTTIWFFSGFPILGIYDSLLVIFIGILTNFSLFLYFKALSTNETSKIIFLFRITPLIVLVLSVIFLKEYISVNQFLGFISIFLVTYITSRPKKLRLKSIFSSVFFLILIFDILTACSAILIKYAINNNSFISILCYESWGIAIGGLIVYFLYPSVRVSFWNSLHSMSTQGICVIFANEVIFVLAKTLSFFAYSLGPTALVSIISATEVLFGVFYGTLLTLIVPSIFKENISKFNLVSKFATAIAIIIGITLITK